MLTWPALRERMRLNWRLSPDDLDAALLLGLPHIAPPADLSPAAPALAAETAQWAAAYLRGDSADSLLLRRRLFRAVYCDWPDLSHVLRLLAAHHARLFFGHDDPEAHTARQTSEAYVHVAGMLSLWRLRRVWIEESIRQIQPGKYAIAAEKIGIPWATNLDADLLEQQIISEQQRWSGDDGDGFLTPGRFDIESRMRALNSLNRRLSEALDDEFAPAGRPRLELMSMMPGITLHYAQSRRFTLEEWLQQLPQLHLRLFCATESDCYRALGVVHRVTPPIRPGDNNRFRNFDDYIARPQNNGYRGLQAICQWPAGSKGALIRWHILTDSMHDLNDWGAMSYESGTQRTSLGLSRSLKRLSRSLERSIGENILPYIRTHDLNSGPDPIYCFTPEGEIVLLDKGSRLLDFAYRIHTQLGHQATRIEVNETTKPLETELRNGDLVRIAYDPLAAGPDFSWQEYVTWERARTNIRTELRRRAAQIHAGRSNFMAELIRWIDIYRRDADRRRAERDGKLYKLPIPASAEIDHFLDRVVARRRLDSRATLYELLVKHPRLTRDLAQRLLSEGIIPSLSMPGGQPLRRRVADIALCPTCRPTPMDTICAYRRYIYNGDMIIIHRPGCPAISSAADMVDLAWDENHSDRWPLYQFKIGCDDEDGLLDRLLALVYDTPYTYLYQVKASVSEKQRADIQLIVAVKLPQLCSDLALMLVEAGFEVTYSPHDSARRSPVQREDRSRELDNPFTLDQVSDWRFYNRDMILRELLDWAGDPHPSSPVKLLHGQQRIGKSSVAARLANGLAEQNASLSRSAARTIPLNIDFSSVRLEDPAAVADLLTQRIGGRLDFCHVKRPPDTDPILWLDRQLIETESVLGEARLLIILDEFDGQFDRLAEHGSRFTLPDRLWGLIRGHAQKIRWLLIAQDAHLEDPRYEGMFSRLLVAPRVHVDPLDNLYARQLIVNPIIERDYRFTAALPDSPDIPARVLDLAAGNPYIIHLIGGELLERLGRGNRRVITDNDLIWTTQLLLGRPAMLDHYTKPLLTTPTRHRIALCLAAGIPVGGRLALSAVSDALVNRRHLMDEVTLHQELTYLEKIGVFTVTPNEFGDRVVSLPVQLIHHLLRRWINDPANHTWSLDLLDTPPNPDLYPGG